MTDNLKLLYQQALKFIEIGYIEGINREKLLLDSPFCNDYDLVHKWYDTESKEDELEEGEEFDLDTMLKDVESLAEKLKEHVKLEEVE